MGILGSIDKGSVAIAGEPRATFAVPLSNAERASLDCGSAEKRNALASVGIDVFGLSKEKIVSEAVALLNKLCGQKLSSQNKPSRNELRPVCWTLLIGIQGQTARDMLRNSSGVRPSSRIWRRLVFQCTMYASGSCLNRSYESNSRPR